MFGWLKRERLTVEQLNAALLLVRRDFADLKNAVEAAVKTYKCIICKEDFARLPYQSDKRCPACQREIKSTSAPAVAQGNIGHRGAGHNTRGIHKGPKP
jgi:hypothetical protein